jgi:extradiol dioxygenase family protein
MTSAPTRLNEPVSLSHGTLEIEDFPETMRFYRDFLGIGCHRHHTAAMSIFHKGEWLVACVKAGKALHRQGPENRWVLKVARPEDVERARAAAVAYRELFKIRQVTPIETSDSGRRSFLLEDLDSNWWEFRYDADGPNGWVDEAFARGDVA